MIQLQETESAPQCPAQTTINPGHSIGTFAQEMKKRGIITRERDFENKDTIPYDLMVKFSVMKPISTLL